MGSTNKTTYYELSQFIGTDKPAWLQDYNGDMLKIDTGINAAKVAADNAASAASGAQGDATDALTAIGNINTTLGTVENTLGTAVGAINTINSLIGNGTPTTSDQTIIGAINSIEGAIAPSEDGDDLARNYSSGEQFTRGGTVYTALTALTAGTDFDSLVLNTDYEISDTLVEQISDINSVVSGKTIYKVLRDIVQVTADGVKTYSQLLDEVYAKFGTDVLANLEDNQKASIVAAAESGVGFSGLNQFYSQYIKSSSSWNSTCTTCVVTDTHTIIRSFRILASNSTLAQTVDGTQSDLSNNVPAEGSTVTIIYSVYEDI